MTNNNNNESRQKVSLNKKLDILKFLREGNSIRATAKEFDVSKGCVQATKDNKNKIENEIENGRSLKKARIVCQSDLNILLWRWFCLARSQGFPINGPILQERALKIALELNINNFTASDGWLQKWKQRNNVKTYKICGESGNLNVMQVDDWINRLAFIYDGYKAEDILNLDESGYFFRALPDKTLNHMKDLCKGGKQGKDRFTFVPLCSASGEKYPLLIIGKSRMPRPLRNIDLSKFNIIYKSSAKAWMTTSIFNDYLIELDLFFQAKKRSVLIFIDNAPVHNLDPDNMLKNIKLAYLPPNLTSKLQPLDAGIIRSLKAVARKMQVLHLLDLMGTGMHAADLVKKLTIFDAIKFISHAWNNLSAETIQKCFKNCGFFTKTINAEKVIEVENHIAQLKDLSKNIGVDNNDFIFEEYIPEFDIIDENILQDDLICEFYEIGIDLGDEDEDEEDVTENKIQSSIQNEEVISFSEAKDMLGKLIRFSSKKGFESYEMSLLNFKRDVEKIQKEKSKQGKIDDFLIKK